MNLYDILLARCICNNKSEEESIIATPLEVTENGEYEAEEGYAYNPVTVNVSSDFSIAQVTIVDNTGHGLDTGLPVVYEAGEFEEGEPAVLYAGPFSLNSGVYKVVLYKGRLLMDMNQEVTTSGSIEEVQVGSYLITGDCTITISEE